MSEEKRVSLTSAAYWRQAARCFADTRMLVFAALIIALRVAVKLVRIPLAAGLNISLDAYVNSLGSLVYGPLVGLAVGAVSDTLGVIIAPNGPYFLPFILVEMSSSFLFGLFFWQRKLSVPRILAARFTVNLWCNIVLTSLFMKWSYAVFYGVEKAQAYALINLVRIAKNLVLFPLEAMIIALIFEAAVPALCSLGLLKEEAALHPSARHWFVIGGLTLLSIGIVLFYLLFLQEFISAHNWRWL